MSPLKLSVKIYVYIIYIIYNIVSKLIAYDIWLDAPESVFFLEMT